MLVARCASGVIWIQGHRPRYARPPRMPHSLPWASLREGDFLSRRCLERLFLRNPHSLPRASCANPFTHVLAQASLDSSVRKSLLRREGDSNPRNPFGVYTLSRRASSTTRASLLVGMRLPHERRLTASLGRPRFLLLTRAHEALVICWDFQ